MLRNNHKFLGSLALAVGFGTLVLAESSIAQAASSAPPPELQVRIVGTANFQGRFTALVEDRVTRTDSFYRVGDMIYGHRITDISSAGMALERSGRTYFLPMDGGKSPISAPATQAGASGSARTSAPSSQLATMPTQGRPSPAAQTGQISRGVMPAVPGRATSSQMASAIQANPALAQAMRTQGSNQLASAARPAVAAQNSPTVWNNGRPVAAAVPSATTPRLAQPASTRWQDFSGLTEAPVNPDSPINRASSNRDVALASNSAPNFYTDQYRSAVNTGNSGVRMSPVLRSADDQRVLEAAMAPGGLAASRQTNNGQPLALPRTAPRQPGMIATAAGAAGAPFRAVGGMFGRSTGATRSMVFPLADYKKLSSGFGYRRHPIGGNTRMHKGIDLSARPGTRIFSAAPGVVTWSGWKGGYGYCIIVDHKNGMSTLYGHCSKLVADVGDYVRSGEYIAEVGSTGASTGPHLHFEVHRNGTAVDPMPYLPMLQ